LNINDVHLIPYSYDYQEFIEQEVDIAEVYSTGGLLRIEEEGISMNKIWPENYGVHFYGDTLFTTEAFAEKNSEVLERFLKASMKGWQKVIEEPAQAVDATMNYAREADPDLQRMMLQASIPLIHAGENKLGTISRERWFGMAAILNVKGQLDTLEVVDQVFDNSHPGLIYGDYQ
jgi:ABC-type nitrate/sulfonate/bicarbonate transport system substrate-binding protein